MKSDSRNALTLSQTTEIRAAIYLERRRAATRARSLERELADIVASAEGSPPDDEHDPEGATIAFERAQVASLLAQARLYLAQLERAERLLRDGMYGACSSCGRLIPFDRLLARPATTVCVECAASAGHVRPRAG